MQIYTRFVFYRLLFEIHSRIKIIPSKNIGFAFEFIVTDDLILFILSCC